MTTRTTHTAVGDIMTAGPCPEYTRERVTFLWGGRETLTPREITELDIPVVDRLWALIYCVLDDRQCRLFGCDCAERALTRDGEATDEELSAAGSAPWYAPWSSAGDAAGSTAGAAAWDAAWAAAGSAAGYTAWASAGSAAGYTAWASAGSAARDAERAWQLARAWQYAEGEKP